MPPVDTHFLVSESEALSPQVSVRAENADTLADVCPFVYVARLLGTHWRPAILYEIANGSVTYNALRARLAPITDKMLVIRNELGRSPRRSYYSLTDRGTSLLPVLAVMQRWARQDRSLRHG